jgi:hypothetical protein
MSEKRDKKTNNDIQNIYTKNYKLNNPNNKRDWTHIAHKFN